LIRVGVVVSVARAQSSIEFLVVFLAITGMFFVGFVVFSGQQALVLQRLEQEKALSLARRLALAVDAAHLGGNGTVIQIGLSVYPYTPSFSGNNAQVRKGELVVQSPSLTSRVNFTATDLVLRARNYEGTVFVE
jgi:hypothetical protein